MGLFLVRWIGGDFPCSEDCFVGLAAATAGAGSFSFFVAAIVCPTRIASTAAEQTEPSTIRSKIPLLIPLQIYESLQV